MNAGIGGAATCTSRTVLAFAYDYGQFHLATGLFEEPDDVVALLAQAHDAGVHVAQGHTTVVVLCPHQNNFAAEFTIEVWDGEPPDDRGEWQQVCQVAVEADERGVLLSSPTLDFTWLPEIAAGRYAVRIAGRGFITRGWPGSTTPGDVWRLQAWPVTALFAPRQLASWTDPQTPAAPTLPDPPQQGTPPGGLEIPAAQLAPPELAPIRGMVARSSGSLLPRMTQPALVQALRAEAQAQRATTGAAPDPAASERRATAARTWTGLRAQGVEQGSPTVASLSWRCATQAEAFGLAAAITGIYDQVAVSAEQTCSDMPDLIQGGFRVRANTTIHISQDTIAALSEEMAQLGLAHHARVVSLAFLRDDLHQGD